MAALTRIEDLCVKLKLDKRQFDRVESLVKILVGKLPSTLDTDDTLVVTYRFNAMYFGEIENRLSALISILDVEPSVLVDCDSELIDGVSSIIGVLTTKLYDLKKRLTRKSLAARLFSWFKSKLFFWE